MNIKKYLLIFGAFFIGIVILAVNFSPENVIKYDTKSINYTNDWKEESVNSINYSTDNLGINLPWIDNHRGGDETNWLNINYNPDIIDSDLAVINSTGITKIRTFCQLEELYKYSNGEFLINEQYADNLDDFLNGAYKYNISVIVVMGSGGNDALVEDTVEDFDGQFHWNLIQSKEGIEAYKNAYVGYINRFKSHKNILMWEIISEPYGSSVWTFNAKKLNVTQTQIHEYLSQSYLAIKPLAEDVPVGFSDYEAEDEIKFQLYSDPVQRKNLVDDSTDIYAMHIYRNNASQVANFSNLTGKPKWVTELGAINYYDPEPKYHTQGGYNELLDTEKNYIAVTNISKKLLDSGFTLIMPWGFASNNGMVQHNIDGSHTLSNLMQLIKKKINGD